VDLVALRHAASAQDEVDAQRWYDEGGNVTPQAVAKRLSTP
jgi:hypothetical protein